MNQQADDAVPPDTFEDLEACFRPVAERYGRDVFAFVYAAGMAGQAAQALSAQASKHASKGIAYGTAHLVLSFNTVANAYAELRGWSPELLAQVDRDVMLAWQGRIALAGQSPLIVLNG